MKVSLLPSFRSIFFIALFLSVLASGPKMLNIDGDLPRHLLMGKVILETRVIPTQEIFSYLYEHRRYIPHEWLADVIYYLANILLGLNGVVLLAGVLIATTFGLIYQHAVSQSDKYIQIFLLTLLGALVTSIHWVTRPHLFTMLLLAIWLILMDRLYRNLPVKIWMFPALMLLWANIHAEFIAGFLVLIAYMVGWIWKHFSGYSNTNAETGKKLFTVTLLSFLVSIINPAGYRIWDIVFGYINNNYLMSHIVETQPPNFTRSEYWPLLLMLSISISLLLTRKDKFSPPDFFLMTGFGVMSLLSARNAHLFGVVAPFILSKAVDGGKELRTFGMLEAAIHQMESRARGIILPIILTILISAFIMAGPLKNFNRFESSVFPIEAVRWLESNPPSGRMFNAFDWGGYILFYLWPEQKVFIESQTDVTGEATKQYEAIITLQNGWEKIFAEYDITWAIIPPKWPLAKELMARGWQTVYQDQTTVVLDKK